MPHLAIDGLSAAYGRTPVLTDISLSIEKGEIMTLIGPSGSGKSTLLRVLIGLLPPKAGQVSIAGSQVDDFVWHPQGRRPQSSTVVGHLGPGVGKCWGDHIEDGVDVDRRV